MARIGILTFWFAHNYGAMLQAYALTEYLRSLGENVEIIPYYPQSFQSQYDISPFKADIGIKERIFRTLKYTRRIKQYKKFKDFASQFLKVSDCALTQIEIDKLCNEYDMVIFGSDQIWNMDITSDNLIYFGKCIAGRKISYAASFGSGFQKAIECQEAMSLLKQFEKISLREGSIKEELENAIGIGCENVLDPIFLLKKDKWKAISKPIRLPKPYILVYLLEPDEQLLNYAKDYANSNGLDLYEIHPLRNKYCNGTKLLDNIGPHEFLWLISEAACVCTNSYHALAFSVIFRGKSLHLPNSKSPERSVELLKALKEYKAEYDFPLYDFEQVDDILLEKMITKSKAYLKVAL